jgi:molybdopterin-guanine dinucleotide biosynthesis protein B
MAGATEVLVGSAKRWALVHELRGEAEPALGALLEKLSPVDLVLIEGYKREPHPKLEIYRTALGKPLLHPGDSAIVAIASDAPLPAARLPVVDIDDVEGIADILIRHAAPIGCVLAHAGAR